MKTLLTATALVLSMTAATSAADAPTAGTVLAGGPIYAGGNQQSARCFFINFGSTNVTPTAQELFEEGSTTAIPALYACTSGSPVVPNQTCEFFTTSFVGAGISCKVTFSGPVTHVRGAVLVYDGVPNSLSTVELR